MAPSKSHPEHRIVRIVGGTLLVVIAGSMTWKLFSSTLSKKEAPPAPSIQTTQEEDKTEQTKEADVESPKLSDKGLSEVVTDILENKPHEGLSPRDEERFPTAEGTFILTTPKNFSQGVNDEDHTVAYFLTKKPGERNEHVVMMFITPLTTGPKGNGLYLLTASVKRGVLDGTLGFGTNYQAIDKVETGSWLSFRRGTFSYSFASPVTPGIQQGKDMLVYKSDKSTEGLWIHIQMPQTAWSDVYPSMLASLETLRFEEN